MISKNKYREDFYYRINVIPIHLAPLKGIGKNSISLY